MSSPVYFPPLFVADTLRSAWPCGRAFHQEAAFSCRGSVWPRQGDGDPQSTTPTPRGGETTRPSVSRETAVYMTRRLEGPHCYSRLPTLETLSDVSKGVLLK